MEKKTIIHPKLEWWEADCVMYCPHCGEGVFLDSEDEPNKCDCGHVFRLVAYIEEIEQVSPLPKWSEHCDDMCPNCQKHTEFFAFTYQWNNAFMVCPHCKTALISGMDSERFVWKEV